MKSKLKMKNLFAIILLVSVILPVARNGFSQSISQRKANHPAQYTCLPCGYDCDKMIYKNPGTCAHCQMPLVKKSTIVFNTIQPSAICKYIAAHPGVVLLDVRTKEEFEGKANPDFGSLQNAINIPIQELETRIAELDAYKNKQVIVYCSQSHRSPRASYLLTQNGFTNVTNLAGGMSVLEDKSCKK